MALICVVIKAVKSEKLYQDANGNCFDMKLYVAQWIHVVWYIS